MNIPGRCCPVDYDIEENFLKKENQISTDVLYVVGGLYGNRFALDEIEKMKNEEKTRVTVVYNGDIHWFDNDLETFKYIENFVEKSIPLLGNVEAEILRKDDLNIGCGCSYPSCVSDDTVERSNEIHRLLKSKVIEDEEIINNFRTREKVKVVNIGNKKIFITHGDEKSLAGWGCSRENLSLIDRQEELKSWFLKNNMDIIACTHTCSTALLKFEDKVVINNGAAGMPNFNGKIFGNIIRIAKTKSDNAICRTNIDNVFIELLPVKYDKKKFLNWFDRIWDKTSPAAISYRNRIINGTNDKINDSIINGFDIL